MSGRRGTKRTDRCDSDGEYTPQTAQPSGLCTDELEHLVNDCVYYLLISDQKKLPVKKADIVKHVIKENSKHFNSVITRAQATLKQIYGIKLVEVEGRKGQYILINDLKDILLERTNSDVENAKNGLLIVILSVIFMNGNVITEVHLTETLKKLGLNIDNSKPYPLFGDVKKLITQEFVRQLYLEYIRIEGTDPPIYEFRWGARASLELSKRHVLELVCEIFQMKIEQWTSQYQDMLRNETSSQRNK